MKKILLASLCGLFINSFAFAGNTITTQPQNYFDGIYTGIGVGAGNFQGKAKNQITYKETSDADFGSSNSQTYTLNKNFNKWGFTGEIFSGYGKTFFQRLYVGGELFLRTANIHANVSQTKTDTYYDDFSITRNTSVDIDNFFSFGGAARVGFLVTPRIMLYAIAGVDAAVTYTDVKYSTNFPSSDPLSSIDQEKFSTVLGFMPGAGIEVMLNNKLSLRGQYTYSMYGNASDDNYTDSEYGDWPYHWTESYDGKLKLQKLARNTMTIGLIYHFNGLGWK